MVYFNELLAILNEMSPYLILGFFISGLLHIYVPKSLYHRFLHRKGFGSVVGAAAIGVPLPLCSCGVIPTAVSLKKEGASDGAMVAFLVGTPQTGVDSILATYSLLGLPFAVIRPIAALCVAIFSGVMVDRFTHHREPKVDLHKMRYAPTSPTCECGCSHSHHHNDDDTPPRKSLWAALRYGYVDLMVDFGTWLVVGLIIAAAITAFVPDSVFALFKEHYLLNIILILLISAPMYICATGSIPIALSLILKGISPGAAFVLLMAGPATNVASLVILNRQIGGGKTAIYLASIIVGAIACALFIDFALPQEWFSSLTSLSSASECGHAHDHHHHHDHEICTHGAIWFQTTTSVIFIVLFINSLIQRWRRRGGGCSH